MATYKAFSPTIEMSGQSIASLISGMGAFGEMAMQILRNHSIENPQPDKWFSQQAFLDALKEIASKTGPKTIQQTGKRIADSVIWPAGIDTFEKALAALPRFYQMGHRGGNAGKVEFTKTGERQAKMVFAEPYPDEWNLGTLQGVAAKFMPGKAVKITLDETQPMRSKGADSTTYLISW